MVEEQPKKVRSEFIYFAWRNVKLRMVENLTVYYKTIRGYVHALEKATFTLSDGEIMGLAGESGCGKTTLGHPELKRRLDWVQLSRDVLKMYPIELSGGMKQRTVMVIATLLNPSLLIADEITSALDVSTQKAVCEMLVEFRDRGFVKSITLTSGPKIGQGHRPASGSPLSPHYTTAISSPAGRQAPLFFLALILDSSSISTLPIYLIAHRFPQ